MKLLHIDGVKIQLRNIVTRITKSKENLSINDAIDEIILEKKIKHHRHKYVRVGIHHKMMGERGYQLFNCKCGRRKWRVSNLFND